MALSVAGQSRLGTSVPTHKGGVNPPNCLPRRRYQRVKGSLSERFWARVDASGDCWLWQGHTRANRYGTFSLWLGDGKVKTWFAHRFAYEALVGSIPIGLDLDHLCRNPSCVNPDHLEPVTRQTNVRRGYSRPAINATKTHCPKGHPYDEANTFVTGARGGRRYRVCRACSKAPKQRVAVVLKEAA